MFMEIIHRLKSMSLSQEFFSLKLLKGKLSALKDNKKRILTRPVFFIFYFPFYK
jgi:hypothetical protein